MKIIEALTKQGSEQAIPGHAFEIVFTELASVYAQEKTHEAGLDALRSKKFKTGDFGKLVDLNPKLLDRVARDAKITCWEVLQHLHMNGTRIKAAVHCGGSNGEQRVMEMIGKKSTADVLFRTGVNEWLGVSLKHKLSKKADNSTMSLYSPACNKLLRLVDEYHVKLFGASSGLLPKVEKWRDESFEEQGRVLARHHKFLDAAFPAGIPHDKIPAYDNTAEGPRKIIYTPKIEGKKVVSAHMSHGGVSFMRDSKRNPSLRIIFEEMAEVNRKFKYKTAGASAKVLAKVLSVAGPADTKKLVFAMMNLSDDQLWTICATMRRTKSGQPKIDIFDLKEKAIKWLKRHSKVDVAYTEDTSCIRVGPLRLVMHCYPGFKNPLSQAFRVELSRAKLAA